jgi:mannose-6-phosphate isomerase
MKLDRQYVEKPWGRTRLPPIFDPPPGQRTGEVWFTGGEELPLLAKYIFTSERLSIQVHPNDEQALARGLPRGKAECWYILEAEPDATLGLGFVREVSKEELRSAALDGSIERLMDWRPVGAGDFYFVPPGTVHAIGAGISLMEFQQNAKVTYRLYDYGRSRELHLEDGLDVATTKPLDRCPIRHIPRDEERVLLSGPKFTLVHATRDWFADKLRWILPLEGAVESNGEIAMPGECLLAAPGDAVDTGGALTLIGTTA